MGDNRPQNRPQNLDPRNRLIITYHRGYMKITNMKYTVKKLPGMPGGKSGHKRPWNDNYGQLVGRRCTSLAAAQEIAKGLFEQHVREIVYWDKDRNSHILKPRKALNIAQHPKAPKATGYYG